MEFEWDPAKCRATVTRRGIDFASAAGIFAGAVIEAIDARRNYGEIRARAISETEGAIPVVVYTDRGTRRRIISARRANEKERKEWLKLFA
jgi:uncharacterized DUF497 family protein